MLDTSYYEDPSVRNVALHGELSSYQRNEAKVFFANFSRKNIIVAGHHPLDDLKKVDQRWITEKSGRYISAHVHRSTQLINHTINNYETNELNIGSTLDYPPQVVIADLQSDKMNFKVAGAQTQWFGFLKDCEDNTKKWMLEDKFYKTYTRNSYIKHLFESLNQAGSKYNSMVAGENQKMTIPSGETEGDWLLLDKILQDIKNSKGESRKYWACQAYYASKATGSEESFWEKTAKLFGWTSMEGLSAIGDNKSLISP